MQNVVGIQFSTNPSGKSGIGRDPKEHSTTFKTLRKNTLIFASVSASQDIPAPGSQAAQGKPGTPASRLLYGGELFYVVLAKAA
jgi:hypothetical protein